LINFSSCRKGGQDPVSQARIFDILRHEGGHFIGEEPPIDTEMPGAFDFRGASDGEFLLLRVVHEEVPEDQMMVVIVGCY